MNDDLISREALKKAFKEAYAGITFSLIECNDIIDNAPTVEQSYQMPKDYIKNKLDYLRPQGECNCLHCDYWKFSQAIINGFVDLMAARGIESIEELEEELHRLNQNKQEDAENE